MAASRRQQCNNYKERNFFYDSEGSKVEIWGYRRSRLYTGLTLLGYLCTLGLLRLLFHWLPHWQLYSTHRRCPLLLSSTVLIKDQYKRFSVHEVFIYTRDGTRVKVVMFSQFNTESRENGSYSAIPQLAEQGASSNGMAMPSTPLLNPQTQDSSLMHYFMYKKLKYIWDGDHNCFCLSPGWENVKCSQFYEATPLDTVTAYRRQVEFGENSIVIPVTPLLQLLVKEGLNPFYVFQIASCLLWFYDGYWMFATCIVVISVATLLWQLYELRKNEKTLRNTVCSFGTALVCRNSNGIFTEMDAAALVPGDVLEIPRGGCMMHCDAVLVNGNCIVNESMLTGESVPVTKTPLPNNKSRNKTATSTGAAGSGGGGQDETFNMKSHSRHVLFCGTRVLQARAYEGEKIRAIVARVGFSTAKGDLVRSILFPKPVVFKFNRDAGRYIMVLAFLALLGFLYTVVIMIQRKFAAMRIIVRALDLVTIVVPPALPVAMTVGIVFAQNRLKKKDIFCISPNTINVCGVTNVVCFDKTGTLTEEGLDLWGLVPMESNGLFASPERDPKQLPSTSSLVQCMATCHSLTCIDGVLSGDPLDLIMFQSLNWELVEESNDSKFGMPISALVRPRFQSLATNLESSNLEIAILRQFTFSSSLQRMSVIVRTPNSPAFTLYVKGAPEMVQQLCRRDTLPTNYHHMLLQYTREGYRVLALAWRPLKISFVKMQRVQREAVECELRFLGLLVLENRLKEETAPVIETLKSANIRPVMVTGDNMLTALSVARDCSMIEEFEKIIVVNANPPTYQTTANSGIILSNGGRGEGGAGDSLTVPVLSGALNGPQQTNMDYLVEFHYAEDLQKPVTEVTAAKIRQRLIRSNSQAMLRRFTTTNTQPLSLADITLRMTDRPDFHLAMSGRTWSVIREYCPHLLPKLLVKGTVFARFSPDQKTQLVESLQTLGYYVTMCGDGANDCGALKTAHAGISLSEAEASVASPFTSKRQNISCVPDLIKEGRCALATSFGTFKFMAGYSLTQFISVLLLYWIGANLADFQFLYIDLVVITTLSITFGHTGAYDRLSIDPPSVRLVSTVTLTSLILQILVNIFFQAASFVYVTNQPWYLPYILDVKEKVYSCHENTAVFTVSVFQYIIIAIVFSKGPPYRQTILQNPLFLMNCIVVTVITIYVLLFSFDWLKYTMLSLTDYPSIYPKLILLSMALANFLLSYLLEVAVDGMAFRHRIRRVKRALFPKMFSHKEYERIRDEIDRACWPPFTRSASVQDLRPEIFTDAAVVTAAREMDENLPRSRSVDPNTMQLLRQQARRSLSPGLSSASESQEEVDDVVEPPQPRFQDTEAPAP